MSPVLVNGSDQGGTCPRCGRDRETRPSVCPGRWVARCPNHPCRLVRWLRRRDPITYLRLRWWP